MQMQMHNPLVYPGQFPRRPIKFRKRTIHSSSTVPLIHLSDEVVDQIFPVAQVATFDKVLELSLPEPTVRAVELERPQEVRRLLKVRADRIDFMDKILHTDHAVLSEVLLNNLVVGQREPLLLNLAISTL